MPFSVTGDLISQMVELEASESMLQYRNALAVRLTGREGLCDENEVFGKLLGIGPPGEQPSHALPSGSAVVLIWGLLYEEGDDIFLQTYVRFLRPPEEEVLSLQASDHELTGRLPTQAFAFAPRHLTQRNLLQIRERSIESGFRQKPSLSPGSEIALPSESIIDSAPMLRDSLPELDFINGVVGYLSYRIASPSRDIANRAEAALRRYSKAADQDEEATATAVAQALLGFLTVLRSADPASGLEAARTHFELAAGLAPSNAEARNLALLSKLYSIYHRQETSLKTREVAEDLLNAASLDPENLHLRQTLADFYKFLEEIGSSSEGNPDQLAAAEIMMTLAALGEPNSKVLAIVDGKPITEAEVREKASAQFSQIERDYEQQKYQLLDGQLQQMIQDRLLEVEAASKGVSKEQLLADLKPADVSDATIDAFYEENKARIPQPKEQVAGQIRQYLEQRGQFEAREKLFASLESKYKVEKKLEPLRAEVAAIGPAKGPENAPVTIVEFSDFQCPFCSRINPTLDQVKAKYGDKVRIVFRQFPLVVHAQAQKAAEASLCANEQGKFWELHDHMFQNQQKLTVEYLKAKAKEMGLNADSFNSCLDSGKFASQVAKDMEAGSAAGVGGTPALFINGRFINGAVPLEQLTKVIEDELKRKGSVYQ